MTQEERGDIVGIYSSGVKMTLKVGLVPMETTFIGQELLTLPVNNGI